jgi:uncharacterized delta-60 repeat protein
MAITPIAPQTYPFGSSINSIALQNDGKILATGYATPGQGAAAGIAKYKTDGSLDSTFGINGTIIQFVGRFGSINTIELKNDGQFLLGGYTDPPNENFFILQYTNNGTIIRGIITEFGSGRERIHDIVIQPDGKVIAVGEKVSFYNNRTYIAIARYNDFWSLDLENKSKSKNKVVLFPNPVKQKSKIFSNINLTKATLTIYNLIGIEVKKIYNISGNIIDISSLDIQNGLYFFNLAQENKAITTQSIYISN